MPKKNNSFWIFPNNIQTEYDVRTHKTYSSSDFASEIRKLFSDAITPVGKNEATVHVNVNYVDDEERYHALKSALAAMENNVDTLIEKRSPKTGKGTSIIIGQDTVYHETATYNRGDITGGICTIFYTVTNASDPSNKYITIHAIGAHKDNYYYLDCASNAFDEAVRKLQANKQWSYAVPGVLNFK